MPNTTQRPLTCSIGWITWAWCPRIRSTAPLAVISSAHWRCWGSTSVAPSDPQWTDTTTKRAPRSRACTASATTRSESSRLERHCSPLAAGRPLKLNVYDRCDTGTPPRSKTCGPASSGVRAMPAWPRPLASNVFRVLSIPGAPWSMAWFEAREHRSYPALAIAVAISGGMAYSGGIGSTSLPGGTIGVSRWQIARSAAAIVGSTRRNIWRKS